MPSLLETLAEADAAAARVPAARSAFETLSDDELMEAQRRLAAIYSRNAASASAVAAEIAWRSRPELGYAGLAQRTGARTPESLVQRLTGSTGREAATLVRVGNVMAEAELLPVADAGGQGTTGPAEPAEGVTGSPGAEVPWDGRGTAWLGPVGRAVAAGVLPVGSADAIRTGLGSPSETVTVGQLRTAAQRLLDESALLNADQLFKRARVVRDEIDAAGVAERERQRHEARYLRVYARRDGMIRVDGLLAPESGGADVLATFQAVPAPRRGGPRFVDPAEQERAQRLRDDPRTTEQLVADALVKLIELGVDADPGALVGIRKPAVRVLVTAEDLRTSVEGGEKAGIGWLEGHPNAVSIGTVQRSVCVSGVLPILFDDDGQCLNVGRDQRLFTAKQRIALAARDGGCMAPGCDRPPSWCEAHHIDGWWRNFGRTDVRDGILLCQHHHLLVHNNGWRITRDGAKYFLIPPREQDPTQTPIRLASKSLPLADLRRRRRAG